MNLKKLPKCRDCKTTYFYLHDCPEPKPLKVMHLTLIDENGKPIWGSYDLPGIKNPFIPCPICGMSKHKQAKTCYKCKWKLRPKPVKKPKKKLICGLHVRLNLTSRHKMDKKATKGIDYTHPFFTRKEQV